MTLRRSFTLLTILLVAATTLAIRPEGVEAVTIGEGASVAEVFTGVETTSETFGTGPLSSTDERSRFTTVTNTEDAPGRVQVAAEPLIESEGRLVQSETELGDDDTTGELSQFMTYRLRAYGDACADGVDAAGVLLDVEGPITELPGVDEVLDSVLGPGDAVCVHLEVAVNDATNIAQGDSVAITQLFTLLPVGVTPATPPTTTTPDDTDVLDSGVEVPEVPLEPVAPPADGVEDEDTQVGGVVVDNPDGGDETLGAPEVEGVSLGQTGIAVGTAALLSGGLIALGSVMARRRRTDED